MRKIIFFILITVAFISCKTERNEIIRIGVLNGPSAMSFIKIIDENPTIENKRIELIIKDEPQQIQALMIQNKLDFAVLPTIMAANMYNKGVNYRMMACPVWGSLYILSNNPQITKIEDLKGTKLAIFGQGATTDVLMQREIGLNRLENLKLDYTYNTNATLGMALQNNIIENAVISEPLVSIILNKNPKTHIVSKLNCQEFFGNSDIDIFTQTAFLVQSSLIKNDGELVDVVNQLYISSCNFINDEPVNAAKLLVKHGFFENAATAMASIRLSNIKYISAFAIEHEVERYLKIFYEFNPASVGGKIPDKNFIYCKEF
jgi:NitT/TauT family transport system substrate-binding protein